MSTSDCEVLGPYTLSNGLALASDHDDLHKFGQSLASVSRPSSTQSRILALARRARNALSYACHKTIASRFVPQAQDAYATHIPVLVGVSQIVAPERILELGGGLFSTPALSNPEFFPTVKHVHTLEDSAEWATKIRSAVSGGDRVTVDHVPSVPDHVATMDLSAYDLIFVDDSISIAERTRTLRSVLNRARASAVVVVHDYEVRSYRNCRQPPWYGHTSSVWRPFTGVLYRDRRLRRQLDRLELVIRRERGRGPSPIREWRMVFERARLRP